MTIVAVAAGGSNTAAIDDAGRLWVSGLNTYGEFGLGDTEPRNRFTVTPLRDIVDVDVSARHVIALDAHGVAHCAGRRRAGNRSTPMREFTAIADEVVDVSCGAGTVSYVRRDGTVWINNPQRCELTSYSRVNELGDATTISSHGTTHAAIDDHGNAVLLTNSGTDTPRSHIRPIALDTGRRCVAAATSTVVTLFIDDHHNVWAATNSTSGATPAPQQLELAAVSCAIGQEHSLFIDGDGAVVGLGVNSRNQLGDQRRWPQAHPLDTATPLDVGFRAAGVACGDFHSIILDNDARVWVAGSNRHGQLGCPGRCTYGFARIEIDTALGALAAELAHDDTEIAYSYTLAELACCN